MPAIDRLFHRHGLGPIRSVEPLGGGQLNNVRRVNGALVLRCREASRSTGSLVREAAVSQRIQGRIPVPELIASGVDDLLGEYLIQKWVPGRSLLEAWIANPDVATREWWIVQWVAVLRALHEERFDQPGEFRGAEFKGAVSWRKYFEDRFRKRCDLLMRVPGADRELVLAAERFSRRLAPVLEDGPCCLIHRDMHFGNVLVDGPHLAALLDFELAEVGPPDYELDTIYRFLQHPALYAEAGAAQGLTASRFASVWIRLKRGYPELFTVRYLRERLSLYALDRELSCLLQVYRNAWGQERVVEEILGRIGVILQGRYGPA